MDSNPVGTCKWDLDTPALCLNAPLLEANIARMADYVADRPVSLRPHAKTHKSPTIAWMQIQAGALGITCAKLGEAEVMAQAGIRDLLIANQIIGPRKIARLVNLAGYTEVMVAVEDIGNARDISKAAVEKGIALRVIIEVDIGMGRCGTAPGQPTLELAKQLLELPGLRFEGIMGYEGHAVMITPYEDRVEATTSAVSQLIATRDLLIGNDIAVGIVSGAGTGTHEITANIEGMTELQVGSYATMDARYRSVGIDFEHALTVVARVISTTRPGRVVIDAGMKTLAPEFGMPLLVRPEGWSMIKLSEEHGFLECDGGEQLHPGDPVEIVPGHGCTTINLHDAYHVTRDDVVEAIWPVAARGRIR